jgi:hypothetical protein
MKIPENVDELFKPPGIIGFIEAAYFLDCAVRHKAPLLTLDKKLKTSAQNLNVDTMEV